MRKPAATFKGEPCQRGHNGTRYIKNHTCVECALQASKRNYARYKAAGKDLSIKLPPVTYAGAPCIHGHDGTRYVSNRKCVECAILRSRAKYTKTPRNLEMFPRQQRVSLVREDEAARKAECLALHKLWASTARRDILEG